MTDADLIELHVTFERPKSREHMERIGLRIRESLQRDLNRHFPAQLPQVYIADIRGDGDALDEDD